MTFVPTDTPDIYTSPDGDFIIRQGQWRGYDGAKTYRAGIRYLKTSYRDAYPPGGQYFLLPEPLTSLAIALVETMRHPQWPSSQRAAAAIDAFEAARRALRALQVA